MSSIVSHVDRSKGENEARKLLSTKKIETLISWFDSVHKTISNIMNMEILLTYCQIKISSILKRSPRYIVHVSWQILQKETFLLTIHVCKQNYSQERLSHTCTCISKRINSTHGNNGYKYLNLMFQLFKSTKFKLYVTSHFFLLTKYEIVTPENQVLVQVCRHFDNGSIK